MGGDGWEKCLRGCSEVAGWAGLGLVLGKGAWGGGWKKHLEILMRWGGWEKCLQGCMRGWRVGWAGIGAWKLPTVHARKKSSRCSYQEVQSSSNNATAHHHVEAIVVSMGQLKKLVVNTREEM